MANDWGWPFSGGYKGYEEGQQFGMTTYDRTGHGDYFHDGFDFGSAKYPGSNIAAVHAGTVVYAGMAPAGYGALGTVVVTKDSSGYYVVYQEFGTSTSNINVSVGQSVSLGQVIATRNTSHLHLGITKKEWLSAQSSAFTDDGTWLNPINIIQTGDSELDPEPNMEELKDMLKLFKINTGYKSLQLVNTDTLKYFAMDAHESENMRKFLYDKEPLFEPAEFQNVLDIIKHVL